MKTRPLLVALLLIAAPAVRAQLVVDGATNTLNNVTNTFTGDVTVGTNGSLTLLVLADNALLTNSVNGIIGRNATAKSNEVRLVSSTARWRMGGSFFVGSNGVSSRLVVSNGALLENFNGNVGFRQASVSNSAVITGAGSVWSNSGSFSISPGFFASSGNRLVVSNSAALVALGSATVGGSGNQVVITGPGSRWANQSGWTFGGGGNRLELSNGAGLVSSNAVIGDLTGSDTNTVLVTGTGTFWTNTAELSIAFGGSPQFLTASNGAAMFIGGHVSLGAIGGGNRIWVTDSGTSCLIGSDLLVGSTAAGNVLTISNGGLVVSSNAFLGSIVGASANSVVVVGAGSVWSNRNLSIGDAATDNQLIATNGGRIFTSGHAVVGVSSGAIQNSVSLSDAGTSWLIATNLLVGSNGALNRLVVKDGASVENLFQGRIGEGPSGNSNQVLVAGAGSVWRNGGALSLGLEGKGNLLVVSNGARVQSFLGILGLNHSGSNNLAVVTGAGSLWTNRGMVVGNAGAGNRLVVSNGAVVASFAGCVGDTGSNNVAIVTGAGSLWTNEDYLDLGDSSVANLLVVSNGAAVVNGGEGYLGTFEAFNAAIVTGPGSLWSNGGTLFVGMAGATNSLVATNGGTVHSDTGVVVGAFDAAVGNRITVEGGTLRTTNATGTGTLEVRRGTNILNAGLVEADSLLLTNSQGTFVFNGGMLITRGAVIGNGVTFNVGISGSTPALWDVRPGSNHFLSTSVFVGSNSSFNQMIVSDGAVMTNTSLTFIGVSSGAKSNSLIVTGPGTQFGGYLSAGDNGDYNRLVISNGAVVRGSAFAVGPQTGADHNEMLVTGTGSKWLGPAGGVNRIFSQGNDNRLTISDGGLVSGGMATLSDFFTGTNNLVLVTGAGSTFSNASELHLGYAGPSSQLTISNGGYVVCSNSIVGTYPVFATNNVAIVTGPGSVWSNYLDTIIGATGSVNRLIISNAGRLEDCQGHLGLSAASSNNVALITGLGSLWKSRCNLYVGENGRGNKLTIADGASVETSHAEIGHFGSDTEGTVTGAGSLLKVDNQLAVGVFTNNCRLVLSSGGQAKSGTGVIGFIFGTNNSALITGTGSSWICTNKINVGGGRSILVVTNGGSVFAGGDVTLGPISDSGSNRIVVDGGTIVATNGAGTAALDLERGTNVLNAGLVDVDLLLMTNAQGFFEFNGGTLITRGALISNGLPFSVGASITPATWDVRAGPTNHRVAGRLNVGGDSSFNQLLLTNGAVLNVNDAIIGFSTFNNEVTVRGPGSIFNAPGGLYVEGHFGRITVDGGGKIFVNGAGSFADIAGSTSTRSNLVLVADSGSRWSVNGTFFVGHGGNGNQLLVSNGATVDSSDGILGNGTSASNNLAVITGAGSFWTNANELYVGNSGAGNSLVVSNGGRVQVNGGVFLGNNISSTNNRVIVDDGTLRATNAAGTGLLEIRRGTTVLNAGLIEADIVRMTNPPQSILQFNAGILSARSSKISSGTTLSIGNGVSPATMVLAGVFGTHDFSGNLQVRFPSNAVLTGNGSLLGGISILNGARLIPGSDSPAQAVGTISFNSAPSLAGTVVMEISKNGTTLAKDQILLSAGTLMYGGSLIVSNLGPTALINGDKFKLFNAPAYAGAFSSISLPPLAPTLQWRTNLLVDGSIEVVGPPAIAISALPFGLGSARVYTQDFNSLASDANNAPWVNNATLIGWYAAQTAPPTDITTYRSSNGNDDSGGLYSFGLSSGPSSSERALGSIAFNTVGSIAYGLCFSNDTANSVSNFTISYTGEQWRNGGSGISNTLSLWYRVSSIALTNPEPLIVTNWTEVTNLDFVSPTVSSEPTGLNGNDPANRHSFSAVRIPGLVVPTGQHVFFRWHDPDDSSADHGMALDDLTIVLAPVAPQITSIVANPSNGFAQISGLAESNGAYVIEAASNLNAPMFWQRIGSNTADNSGVWQFTDTNAPSFRVRFYRALAP